MKVSVELNVSDKEFYDVMMKSLQEELNHVSKKKLELKEGLKYKKKSTQRKGVGSEITVYIKKLVPNELYVATFNTAIDHTMISYKIEALDESKIRVTYKKYMKIYLLKMFLLGDKRWRKSNLARKLRRCLKKLKNSF